MNWDLKKYYDDFVPIDKSFYIAKQTLTELIMHSDSNGITRVSNESIAKSILSCHRTVCRHISILSSMGIVQTLTKGGKSTALRKIVLIGHGSDFSTTLVRHGSDMEVTQEGHGSDMEVTLVRHGSDTQMSNEEKFKEKVSKEDASVTLLSVVPHITHTDNKKIRTKKPTLTKQQIIEQAKLEYEDDSIPYITDFLDYRESISDPVKSMHPIVLFMNIAMNVYNSKGAKALDDEVLRMKAGEWKTLYPKENK